MGKCKVRYISFVVIFAIVMQIILPGITELSFADDTGSLTVNMNKIVTGTAPFNTTLQSSPGFYPGDDYSSDDDYVRSLDTVAYTIDYSVNPAGTTATNLVIKANLEGSDSVKWNENLPSLYSGLTLSNDGKNLTYNLGDVLGGNAFSFTPTANVDGNATNGEKFKLKVVMESDNVDSKSIESKEIIVSASPKFDLGIETYTKKNVKNANDVLGTVVYSTIEVMIDDGKGSERVSEDLKFDVDLSNFRENAMNAEIYNSSNTKEKALARHGDFGYIHWYGKIPWGNSATNNNSSVVNTAEFAATQSVVGGDISVTISKADLTGNHIPTHNADGSTISLDKNYVVAGTLAIWIPASEIPSVDTNVNISYKNFDPTSISGQSNYKLNIEPLANNISSVILKKPTSADGASKSYFYGDVWYSYKNGDTIYGEMKKAENSGLLIMGEEFDTSIKYGISGDGAHTDVAVVTKFDSNVIELVKDASGIAHRIERVSEIDESDVIVEYGVGAYANWNEMRSLEGKDSDSISGWYQNINDAPSEITKIRIRTKTGIMPSHSNIYIKLNTKIKDNTLVNTKVPVFLSYTTNKTDSGKWRHSSYNLDTGLPSSEYRSDNAIVTGVKSRVEIALSDTSEKVGNKINVSLDSSLTAKGKTGFADDVELRVSLPTGLQYVLGSSKKLALSTSDPSVIKNADGSSLLTWSLGRKEINVALENISFDTKIDSDLKNLTELAIKASISTPLDASNESLRSDQKSVVATNDSAWGIFKSVEKEEVDIDEELKYTLNYYQFTDKVLNNFEFIDILPYLADGRTPNSDFNGSYSLESVQVYNGETFLVTDSLPSTINVDPDIKGSTSWVAYGSIPNESVTAIKVFSSSFPNNQSTRSIDVCLRPSGNLDKDVYTNRFTARTSDIMALLESNDVSIKVKAKSVPTPTGRVVVIHKNGTTILKEEDLGVKNVGVAYTTSPLSGAEYDKYIIASPANKDGNYINGTIEVVYFYVLKPLANTDGNLVVRHIDKESNILLDEENRVDKIGEQYVTTKKDILNYTFTNVDSLENGVFIDGTINVNYFYTKNKGTVRAKYLEVNTNRVLSSEVLSSNYVGQNYITDAKNIANFDRVNTPQNSTGVYIDGTIDVIYYYNAKSSGGGSSNSDQPKKSTKDKTVKKENTKKEVIEKEVIEEEVIEKEVIEEEVIIEDEIIVEIIDEEIPEGNLEVEKEELFEIEDDEIPLGEVEITREKLPQTGNKIPYANYILGILIMTIGLVTLRKESKRKMY